MGWVIPLGTRSRVVVPVAEAALIHPIDSLIDSVRGWRTVSRTTWYTHYWLQK